jgi:hypothetical protein
MTITHTSSRMPSRTPRRRFSSAALNANRSPGSPKTAPLSRKQLPRRVSLSPPNTAEPTRHDLRRSGRSHYTDGSEYEDEQENVNPFDFRPTSRSRSPKSLLFSRQSRPTAYSSLPPTPIVPEAYTPTTPLSPISPGFETPEPSKAVAHHGPFSLWDYLREELLATDFDSHQEQKWERVSNFLSMPVAMEKVRSELRVHRILT